MLLDRLNNQFSMKSKNLPEPPKVTAKRFYYDTVGTGPMRRWSARVSRMAPTTSSSEVTSPCCSPGKPTTARSTGSARRACPTLSLTRSWSGLLRPFWVWASRCADRTLNRRIAAVLRHGAPQGMADGAPCLADAKRPEGIQTAALPAAGVSATSVRHQPRSDVPGPFFAHILLQNRNFAVIGLRDRLANPCEQGSVVKVIPSRAGSPGFRSHASPQTASSSGP